MKIQEQKRFQFLIDSELIWEDLPVEIRQKLLEQIAKLVNQAWKNQKEVANESQDHS